MWVIQSEGVGSNGLIRYFWIPNFNNIYTIGDDGSLWSRYKGVGNNSYVSNDWKILGSHPDPDGYHRAFLSLSGRVCKRFIHQLVCEAVHGPCSVGLEVCHNDGDVANNWYWNLRYDTRRGNNNDRFIHGTDARGERNNQAVLNWEKVREIRLKYVHGKYTHKSLALEYCVSEGCVQKIINNRTWVEGTGV
jgi:hypothetical protein